MNECFTPRCNNQATFKVDGYAEEGQAGGYVYQFYCGKCVVNIKAIDIDKDDGGVYRLTGLEYITDFTRIVQ